MILNKGCEEGTWRLQDKKNHLIWCEETYKAIKNTNATLILTEWNEFRNLDFDKYDELNSGKYFLYFKNIYNKQELTKKVFKTYR